MGDDGETRTRVLPDGRPASGLVPIPGFPFPVLASAGFELQAQHVARRCARAYGVLGDALELSPGFTLKVLSGADWHNPSLPYGMPYYASAAQELVVAGESADFWRRFVPLLEQAAPSVYAEVVEVYGATADLSRFFNLLVVHELGHAFLQPGAGSHWLDETFANICLHTSIAVDEPDVLPALVTFPKAMVSLDPGVLDHVNLADFQTLYSRIDPLNYGWYQCHFHGIAKLFHDSGGRSALQRLGRRLRSSDDLVLPAEVLSEQLSPDADVELTRVLLAWAE